MWLYICTSILLLNIVNSYQVHETQQNNGKLNDPPGQTGVIFANVIKNISKVNNVLHELITNYEHLQKIYKSQENIESEYSDPETDEIFKGKNRKERSKVEGDGITKRPIVKNFAATQMYWSDHDEDEKSDDESEEEVKNTSKQASDEVSHDELKEVKKINKFETNDREPKIHSMIAKTTTLKPVTSEESSVDSIDISKEDKAVTINQHKPNNHNVENFAKPKQTEAEVIFIDTHKKTKEIKPKLLEPAIPAIQYVHDISRPKTRYNKVSQSKYMKTNSEINSNVNLNGPRNVKKIMYSEAFSPSKIWNDILNNKPIQLEAHNEIIVQRQGKSMSGTGYDARSKDDKTALVFLTNSKKKKKESEEGEIEVSESEQTSKQQFKTDILRQAYGDACLKLVIKKCYMACKKVSKSVCSHVNCKSAVKSSFLSFSKTGCIQEFNGKGIANDTKNYRFPEKAIPLSRKQDSSFVDLTREGALSACLPNSPLENQIRRNQEKDESNGTQRQNPETHQLNLLRDRYEKACKKISYKKCKNACKFAAGKTCARQNCSSPMKKQFKKRCPEQCKRAYQLNDSSESNSDNDSDYDSEKGSDEDSESDASD